MKTKLMTSALSLLLLPLAAGCTGEGPPETPRTGRSSDLLALLPAESNFVLYADAEAIRASDLGQNLQQEMAESVEQDEEYREFVEATGVDLQKDVNQVWVSSRVTDNDEDDWDASGALLRGAFDPDRIVAYAKTKKGREFTESEYEGYTLYHLREGTHDEFTFCFLDDQTLALGSSWWVRNVVTRHKNGGKGVLDNPVMVEYIRAVPGDQHLWGVFFVQNLAERWAEAIRKRGSGFKGTRSIESMKTLLFYAYFAQMADLHLRGEFATAEEAQLVEEMLNGFKAMAKMMVADDREAIDMVNQIKVRSTGSTLEVDARIGKDFVQKVDEKRKTLRGQQFKLM